MEKLAVSRRKFVGSVAAAIGCAGIVPEVELFAQKARSSAPPAAAATPQPRLTVEQYDAMAKLSNNENPYGPPESVLKAMNGAMKYANRYGYPDGGIVQAIADHHGLKPENVLLGAGSTETLCVADACFLQGAKKVMGVDPTYLTVYAYATGTKSDSIRVPLRPDYSQDVPRMIHEVKANYRDIGLVYLCNPNNPTGIVVPKQEVRQMLDSIPADVPVLIDEAYHHFVEDPSYETSVGYVKDGRSVIVTRTFSKIVGLAGMRLGYALAPKEIIDRMKVYSINYSENAIVKWGAVAALKDTASQAKVKQLNAQIRDKTIADLRALGYEAIPSQTNFFMVNVRRHVVPVAEDFRKRGVLVGRPFPPMVEHLRVSVGSADEMARFMSAFKEIFPADKSTTAGM